MQLIETQTNVPWMPRPNRVRLILDEQLPPGSLTTSTFVLAFDRQRLLMTKLTDRGWDLPGGHIEPGESPESALRREVLEETGCVLGEVRLLGYQHLSVLCAVPPNYRYPYPDSYQLFYLAQVQVAREFLPTAEAADRHFFGAEAAERLPWIQAHRRLYEIAFNSIAATITQNGPTAGQSA
ncbi:MAG: NUDIX domain-containing protein [Anaerolineales bacterium]